MKKTMDRVAVHVRPEKPDPRDFLDFRTLAQSSHPNLWQKHLKTPPLRAKGTRGSGQRFQQQ